MTIAHWTTTGFGEAQVADSTSRAIFALQTHGETAHSRLLFCTVAHDTVWYSEPTQIQLPDLLQRPVGTCVAVLDVHERRARLPHRSGDIVLRLHAEDTLSPQDYTPAVPLLRSVAALVLHRDLQLAAWTDQVNNRLLMLNQLIEDVLAKRSAP
jgi:hypothetical protein